MATVLENSPPFETCFSYATLLAEDGEEMHKSWGNAIEFNEAADRMGVDVMRWLYSRQKPEKDLLFGYNKADEVRRQFLIPLWNVYSFFVTYANIDQWEPDEVDAKASGRVSEEEASFNNLLDKWILARLNQIISQTTDHLENYDAYATTMLIEEFLDDLSNWYVRRSRRRFWKSEQDADKHAAYTTLYHVLTTLCRLLAPFIPFVTEEMYQNLVRSVDADALKSVHHTTWPQADESMVEKDLLTQMALARQIVALGHSARNGQGIKLRQPLARASIHLKPGVGKLNERMAALVQDELNVKQVSFVTEESDLIAYRLLPVNKVLGPRFGEQFPAVRAALSELEPLAAVKRLQAQLPLHLEVEGQKVELSPEDVLVREESQEGLAAVSERGVTVAIDIVITSDLEAEGLMREVIRRIQNLRKEANFALDDRIVTTYQAAGELAEAIEAWKDYIAAETLSVELIASSPNEEATTSEDQVDGHTLKLSVRKS